MGALWVAQSPEPAHIRAVTAGHSATGAAHMIGDSSIVIARLICPMTAALVVAKSRRVSETLAGQFLVQIAAARRHAVNSIEIDRFDVCIGDFVQWLWECCVSRQETSQGGVSRDSFAQRIYGRAVTLISFASASMARHHGRRHLTRCGRSPWS